MKSYRSLLIYGDLLLGLDGRIAYVPVNPDFETIEFLSTDVAISAQGLWQVQGATYRVKFAGVHWPEIGPPDPRLAKLASKSDNLLSHTPSTFGGSPPTVSSRPVARCFQSKNDRREALQFWREVVEGRLNPTTLPVIYRARA